MSMGLEDLGKVKTYTKQVNLKLVNGKHTVTMALAA